MTKKQLEPPPQWAFEAAIQHMASSVAGHPVALEDVRYGLGREVADDAVPEVVFMLREDPDKFNAIPLVSVVIMAFEIMADAN